MGRADRVPAAVLVSRARGGQALRDGRTLGNPGCGRLTKILLATEGREIPAAAIEKAAELAGSGGSVAVFSVVRVWGTSLGLPNPGLLPSKREWDAQRAIAARAVKALKKHGVRAEAHVLATRKATKRIVSEAERVRAEAIVMGADPPRNRLVADLMWSQEPYRVQRRAKVPVHLVVTE